MEFVPDHFKRKKIHNEVVRNNSHALRHGPEYLKTQEMCDEAVCMDTFSLCFALEQKYLRDDNDDWHDNKLIEWYEGYEKRKSQKA